MEREGIKSHRRFDLTSTQQTLDVPITDADVPNLFVSVTLIKGLAAQIAAAGTDPAKLQALQASLKASADDLAAAIAANTVADPNTPPSGAQG